jgi:hypothetical protein
LALSFVFDELASGFAFVLGFERVSVGSDILLPEIEIDPDMRATPF